MEGDVSRSDEVRVQLDRLAENLENVERQDLANPEAEGALRNSVETLQGIQELLESPMVDTTLGECRMDVPFAPLKIIQDESGVRYCCTHDPQHCSNA